MRVETTTGQVSSSGPPTVFHERKYICRPGMPKDLGANVSCHRPKAPSKQYVFTAKLALFLTKLPLPYGNSGAVNVFMFN